jgi:hypothetical protein
MRLVAVEGLNDPDVSTFVVLARLLALLQPNAGELLNHG